MSIEDCFKTVIKNRLCGGSCGECRKSLDYPNCDNIFEKTNKDKPCSYCKGDGFVFNGSRIMKCYKCQKEK